MYYKKKYALQGKEMQVLKKFGRKRRRSRNREQSRR